MRFQKRYIWSKTLGIRSRMHEEQNAQAKIFPHVIWWDSIHPRGKAFLHSSIPAFLLKLPRYFNKTHCWKISWVWITDIQIGVWETGLHPKKKGTPVERSQEWIKNHTELWWLTRGQQQSSPKASLFSGTLIHILLILVAFDHFWQRVCFGPLGPSLFQVQLFQTSAIPRVPIIIECIVLQWVKGIFSVLENREWTNRSEMHFSWTASIQRKARKPFADELLCGNLRRN